MRCAACCSCCACELTIITKATTRALPSATPSCEGWLPDQTSVSTILGARLIVVLIEELGCLALEPLLGGSWRGGPPTWAQGHTEGAQRRDEHSAHDRAAIAFGRACTHLRCERRKQQKMQRQRAQERQTRQTTPRLLLPREPRLRRSRFEEGHPRHRRRAC